jgi:hypothetical protein
MTKILTRAVPVLGVVLPAGTELTEDQAKLVTNPKAFEEWPDTSGPDANDARAYQNHVQRLNNDAALRKQPDKDADNGEPQNTDDSAARGAKLARGGGRASAPAANG